MNDDIIDVEAAEVQVVVCPNCGQQNRLRKRQKQGIFRCGLCKTALPAPFIVSDRIKKRGSSPMGRFSLSRRGTALVLFAILALGVIAFISSRLRDLNRPRQPYTPNPSVSSSQSAVPGRRTKIHPSYIRSATEPNGHPWPTSAAYLPGYPLLASGGLSSVMIDNSGNSSDVFLKLVALDSIEAFPVRVCYIPAASRFTFREVVAGRYDVRYRDLVSGSYYKTEDLTLTEKRTYQGTEYSRITLTLYKVPHGNMQTEAIDESQF